MIIPNNKAELISEIMTRLLPAYNNDGTLSESYYENIILEDITKE